MKKGCLFLWTILFSFALLSQEKNFTVSVIQDGTSHPVSGQEIYLQKQPFRIQVTLANLPGIYLYADFSDSIYKLVDTQKIPDFELLPPMTMAEATFNEDQELIINKDGWCYWFYDPGKDWHRFDKEVDISGKTVTAFKTITRFFFSEVEKSVPVKKTKEPLYLFFVAVDKTDGNGAPQTELKRLKLKINWE